jgi:carbonic anhydrase/acetyltransferase-like protein (isoleucine patch superfamily)
MFGACVIAEGQTLELGENCIVMENAVIRSTDEHPTIVGAHSLIGPHAHLVGCALEECVFIATGVYGVERAAEGETNMREITQRRSDALRSHINDVIVKEVQ